MADLKHRLTRLEAQITPGDSRAAAVPDDALAEIRAVWRAGNEQEAAGLLRDVLTLIFGDYDTFTIEDTGAAIWPMLTAPDTSRARLIDLFTRGRAINAEIGEGQLWAKRFQWVALFRSAPEA